MPNQLVESNPMESLRKLLRLPSMTNVSALPTSMLDTAQGLGDYEPSEAELMDAQLSTGGRVSRENLRSGAMSNIKKQLAERGAQQEFTMRREGAAGERELAKQRLVNEGGANIARIQGDTRLAQAEAAAEAKQAAIDRLLGSVDGTGRSVNVSGVGGVGAVPRSGATQAQTVPEGMDKRLGEARKRATGFHPLDYIYEKMGGTPQSRTDYEGALTSVLTRTGKMQQIQAAAKAAAQSGMSAADAIAQFEEAGLTLDPYEQEYLNLKLGQ